MTKTIAKRAALLLILATAPLLTGAAPQASSGPEIRIDDVTRFYAIYDAAGGKPTAEQLQHDYLDKGSTGLAEFARLRNFTGERMAAAIAERPAMFADARRCTAVLPRVTARLAPALAKLAALYPKGIYPPVTLAVGRGKTGGTANASGVMIGLETLCAFDFMEPDPEDRFVYVIAHEYAHVQQPAAQVEDPDATVLTAALIEGAAEFVGELISGSVSYRHLITATKGREKALETAFLADKDRKALGSDWLYNGRGTPERPGDLGYWVGYRIAKAYYQRAADKRAALRDIIEMSDAKTFLAKSGWTPGMVLK